MADPELRRALLISAGCLAALAKRFDVDGTITLYQNGAVLGEFTLNEALDIADRALEPEQP